MNKDSMGMSPGMGSNNIWVLIVVLILIVGGVGYALYRNSDKKDAMMSEDIMEKDTMSSEENMMKSDSDDVMMKDEMDAGMMKDEAMSHDSAMMMSAGSYEAFSPEKLARAGNGKVVLFFRASWCPTCKELDADIKSHLSAIPAGLTILDVNYDTMTALKQKYGVTYQHTLVQVDANGAMLAKWSGSPTLVELASHLK